MDSSVFEHFPELQTSRLRLVKLSKEHWNRFSELVAYRVNPKALKTPEAVFQKTEKDYSEHTAINWAIMFEGELIGLCGYFRGFKNDCGEIGYVMHKNFRNQAFMEEAAQAVIQCGFEQMKLTKILAFTNLDNLPSTRLLEKLNFEQTDELLDGYTKFALTKIHFHERRSS